MEKLCSPCRQILQQLDKSPEAEGRTTFGKILITSFFGVYFSYELQQGGMMGCFVHCFKGKFNCRARQKK